MISPGTFLYSAFGLSLALPVKIPFLRLAAVGARLDATVAFGPIARSLANPAIGPSALEGGWEWSANGEGTVLLTTQLARYLVVGGSRIEIDPITERAQPEGLVQFAILYVLPALLLQRGLLALHGNTVVGPAGAAAILGDSGAGKSTLTAALLVRGYRLLSDDVAALGLDQSLDVQAFPGYPLYKLNVDAQARLDSPADARWPMPGSRRKVALRVPVDAFAAEVAPLRTVVALKTAVGDDVVVRPVSGAAKLQLFLDHAYLAPLVQLRAPDLTVLPQLIQTVPLYQASRPAGRWTVDALADAVMSLMEG